MDNNLPLSKKLQKGAPNPIKKIGSDSREIFCEEGLLGSGATSTLDFKALMSFDEYSSLILIFPTARFFHAEP